jgi:integrase
VLGAVADIRPRRGPATQEELEDFEVDVMAGFVLARAAAGLAESSIRGDVSGLTQVRAWFGRPLWEMGPEDADRYFGRAARGLSPATRAGRAKSLSVYFEFLELRHGVDLHRMTGRVVTCPLDEMNRPSGWAQPRLRIPPPREDVEALFAGWREDLVGVRKFAPAARGYTAMRLAGDLGLRLNELRMLDLADVRWDLGAFGKLNVRHGKGARRRGPKQRLVPMINGADVLLRWYVGEVWGHLDDDHTRPGAPLFAAERHDGDGHGLRVGADVLRQGLAGAVARHLPGSVGRLTPHTLRHYCASQLYAGGMDLLAVQELLGHTWVSTTMGYIHVEGERIERAWARGQQEAGRRWEGLLR